MGITPITVGKASVTHWLTNVKAHVNNIDQVRFHYKEIMAELAESNLMNDLLTQLGSKPVNKPVSNLSSLIRNSNYGLC